MDLCKAAAQAAVDVMTDEQSLGVLTFNDQFEWDITLRNVGQNRDDIRQKIAVDRARRPHADLPRRRAGVPRAANRKGAREARRPALRRPVIPGRLRGARHEDGGRTITVSSVAVGPSADPELLRNIAKWGKGRAYQVADAKELPQIFVKEAKNAATPAFDEKQIKPVVKTPAFLTGVDLDAHPAIEGPHRDGPEGHGARAARDRRRRSAAGVLADRPRPDRGVRVRREGSLGRRLGQVARLRPVLHRRRAGARAAPAASSRPGSGARAHSRHGEIGGRIGRGAGRERRASGSPASGGAGPSRGHPAARRGAEAGRARPLRNETGRGREHASRSDARRDRDTATRLASDRASSCRILRPSTDSALRTRSGCARSPRRPAARGVPGPRRSRVSQVTDESTGGRSGRPWLLHRARTLVRGYAPAAHPGVRTIRRAGDGIEPL